MLTAVAILVTIPSMHLSAGMARRRGRSVHGWMVVAATVGPLGLPLLWLLPARSASTPIQA
ncbi:MULTISPECIES: hypothetical protein [Pseudomonadota]|uniref:hypothetical protein n=1 Tax=Pseudomonadota TaxID=1224 RepID=UPI0037174E19